MLVLLSEEIEGLVVAKGNDVGEIGKDIMKHVQDNCVVPDKESVAAYLDKYGGLIVSMSQQEVEEYVVMSRHYYCAVFSGLRRNALISIKNKCCSDEACCGPQATCCEMICVYDPVTGQNIKTYKVIGCLK